MQCWYGIKDVSKTLVREQALNRAVHTNVQGRCFSRERVQLAGLRKTGCACGNASASSARHGTEVSLLQLELAWLLCASDLASMEDCSAARQCDIRRGSCHHLAACGSSTEALHLTVLPRWLLCPRLLHLLRFHPEGDCQPRQGQHPCKCASQPRRLAAAYSANACTACMSDLHANNASWAG